MTCTACIDRAQGTPVDIDTSLDACSTFGLAPGALLHTAQVCALCGMPHILLLT